LAFDGGDGIQDGRRGIAGDQLLLDIQQSQHLSILLQFVAERINQLL
jgi:hypothetical protein